MKNVMRYAFVHIFVSVFVFFAIGCSSQSLTKSQYQAEKMLFKAGKLYQRVMINPRIAAPSDYEAAIAAYEQILSKFAEVSYSETIENIKKQSYLAIAELWLLQGEIHAAIAVYERFLTRYPDDKTYGSIVHFANARSNERIFNLNKAIFEYQTLLNNYGKIDDPLKPNQNLLNLPLKVARLKRTNEPRISNRALYEDALSYYNSVIAKWPKSPAAFIASYYTASIYADQQQWRPMLNTLNQLAKDYPDREEIPGILLSMGNTYMDGLNDLSTANRIFDGLLRKYREDKIKGYVHFAKARLLVKKRNYKQSRELLTRIIEKYPNETNLCAAAQLTLASTYETEGTWERALVEYRWVQENHPLTIQGLYVPVYIADYYRRKGKANLAETAFKEAIAHYQRLIKKHPKTVLAATAQEFIIHCLSVQEKWPEAAEAATSLRTVHPGSRTAISSYLFLGQIYEKSNDFKKAIAVYENFSQEFPDHPIVEKIQHRIESIQKRI